MNGNVETEDAARRGPACSRGGTLVVPRHPWVWPGARWTCSPPASTLLNCGAGGGRTPRPGLAAGGGVRSRALDRRFRRTRRGGEELSVRRGHKASVRRGDRQHAARGQAMRPPDAPRASSEGATARPARTPQAARQTADSTVRHAPRGECLARAARSVSRSFKDADHVTESRPRPRTTSLPVPVPRAPVRPTCLSPSPGASNDQPARPRPWAPI